MPGKGRPQTAAEGTSHRGTLAAVSSAPEPLHSPALDVQCIPARTTELQEQSQRRRGSNICVINALQWRTGPGSRTAWRDL